MWIMYVDVYSNLAKAKPDRNWLRFIFTCGYVSRFCIVDVENITEYALINLKI